MKINELTTKLQNIKRGQYFHAIWCSVNQVNGVECVKISSGVCRNVKYANIKGVEVKNKPNPNETYSLNGMVVYNAKTHNTLVRLYTSRNPKHKVHSVYKVNGVEVDKETYESYVKPRQSNGEKLMFNVKLENLIDIA